jgi:hypothetical protein
MCVDFTSNSLFPKSDIFAKLLNLRIKNIIQYVKFGLLLLSLIYFLIFLKPLVEI